MYYLDYFFSGWLWIVIILSFIRIKWAIALFLAYIFLVPRINLGIPILGSGDNFVRLAVLTGFLVNSKQINNISYKPFIPFIIYFIVLLLIMPFQQGLPFNKMLGSWFGSFLNVLSLPFIMYNLCATDNTATRLFRKTIIFCVIVSVAYGLFLASLGGGLNPYTMLFLSSADQGMDWAAYYEAAGGGRMFGRISSVFMHPMLFGLFLGLSLVYLFYIKYSISRYLWFVLVGLVIVMSIICGVRSVLGGIVFATLYYLIMAKNFKFAIYLTIFSVIVYYISISVPELNTYLGSFAEIEATESNVRGSSLGMRLNQLYGALKIASDNPLFGMGYGWTADYITRNGDHPVCLAFESLLFVAICNSGLVGVCLWIFVFIKFTRINTSMKLREVFVVNSLIVFYLSYSLVTGEFGYMRHFLIFYALMLGESLRKPSTFGENIRKKLNLIQRHI